MKNTDLARGVLPTYPEESDPRVVRTEAAQRIAAMVSREMCRAIGRGVEQKLLRRWMRLLSGVDSEWQPFETAPKHGGAFLAASKFCGVRTVERIHWDPGTKRWEGAHGVQRFDGWMSLPEFPEGSIAKDGRAASAPTPDAGGSAGAHQ